MIKIIFKDGQGLGNQLWIYASAKSIAEKLNFKLYVQDFQKFKGKSFLELDSCEKEYISNKDQSNLGIPFETFKERLYYDHQLNYIVSSFDEKVLEIKDNTILDGLFQSEKYFFGELGKLKRYIKLNSIVKKNNLIHHDVCIINLRGGEYKRHKDFLLPMNYWNNAIKNFKEKYNINKFKVVTDDYYYAKALFPNFEVIHGNIGNCYATIYNCSNIIVSNSTFSYFPCKTGIKKRVIAPMHWARYNNKFDRWISPCNIYKDWLWQDINSNLRTYDDCKINAELTNKYYKTEYTVLINKKYIPSNKFLKIIPKSIKKRIKKFLSIIFPKHFG